MKRILPLIFGLASGLLSFYIPDSISKNLISAGPFKDIFFANLPGFIFGIVLSLYLLFNSYEKPWKIVRLLIFALICGLAYYTAVSVTINFSTYKTDLTNFLLGGLCGGVITLIAFRILVAKISTMGLIVLAVVSSLASLSYPLLNRTNLMEETAAKLLFLVWQTAMLYGIAYFYNKSKIAPQ